MRAAIGAEYLKVRGRPAFWVVCLAYFGSVSLIKWQWYHNDLAAGLPSYREPGALSEVFGTLLIVPAAALTVLLVLIIGAEREWRTDRQNVIDGLSRTEYFLGKLALCATMTLLVWAGTTLVLWIFLVFDMRIGASQYHPASQLNAVVLTGGAAALMMAASGALLFSTLVSSTGAAGACMLCVIVASNLVAPWIARQGSTGEAIAAYLPTEVFAHVLDPSVYGPVVLARAFAYVVLACGVSWFRLRYRDL